MNKLPFRDYHLLELLDSYDKASLPADLVISQYFKSHKALGSKDRAAIAETAYALIRWQGLLDYIACSRGTWKKRLEIFTQENIDERVQDQKIPPHIRCSCPKILFDLLVANYGDKKAFELGLINNSKAPVTVRANRLKLSREQLLEKWKDRYQVRANDDAACAIDFEEKIHFFSIEEFKQGLFEVQDAASQCIAALVQAQPGQLVMDYCAGSGGKSLAIAPEMEGKGQIYLVDIRPRALVEAKRRMKRAGVQNAQTHLSTSPALATLKKKMDWVLVDAPCSGSGTLRRNPDMKWRFDDETIPKLVGMQRTIFERALSFMKPDGRIVYATCSILKEENQEQMMWMTETYGLEVVGNPYQSLPATGKKDGFFGVVFKRQKNS